MVHVPRKARRALAPLLLFLTLALLGGCRSCHDRATGESAEAGPRIVVDDASVTKNTNEEKDAAPAPPVHSDFSVVARGGAEQWTLSRTTDGRVVLGGEGTVATTRGNDLVLDDLSYTGLPISEYIPTTLTDRAEWLGGDWPASGFIMIEEIASRSYDAFDVFRWTGRTWTKHAVGVKYNGVAPYRDGSWLGLRVRSNAIRTDNAATTRPRERPRFDVLAGQAPAPVLPATICPASFATTTAGDLVVLGDKCSDPSVVAVRYPRAGGGPIIDALPVTSKKEAPLGAARAIFRGDQITVALAFGINSDEQMGAIVRFDGKGWTRIETPFEAVMSIDISREGTLWAIAATAQPFETDLWRQRGESATWEKVPLPAIDRAWEYELYSHSIGNVSGPWMKEMVKPFATDELPKIAATGIEALADDDVWLTARAATAVGSPPYGFTSFSTIARRHGSRSSRASRVRSHT